MKRDRSYQYINRARINLGSGREYTLDLEEVAAIHPDRLADDMAGQPGLYAWWATIVNLAEQAVEQCQGELDILLSQLYSDHRKQERRASPTDCKHAAMSDPKYIAKRDELMKWRSQYRRLLPVKEALQFRKDMLQSLNAHGRDERRQF